MKSIFCDISGKIDPLYIKALNEFKIAAEALKIPFFIIGASARDFILEYCYGIRALRATTDIDLAIRIPNWNDFNKLCNALITTGRFRLGKQKQRIHYNSVILDIVPFGEITDEFKKVSWPPEHEIIMNMLGFEEVYEHAITLKLSHSPELLVKLPTLSGLAILKLLSWKEKYPERKRDAEDLLLIMNNYDHKDNTARLFETEIQLFEEESYDPNVACVRLLGRDMARIAHSKTLEYIVKILIEETAENSKNRLIFDMINASHDFNRIYSILIKLLEGFRD